MLLQWVARFVIRWWYLILALSLVLGIGSFFLLDRIRMDTDITSLLPRNESVVRDFIKTTQIFGSTDRLIIVAEQTPNISTAKLETFLEHFAKHLETLAVIRKTDYSVPHITFNKTAARIEDRFEIDYHFYTSPSGKLFLMFITPTEPPGDITFCRRLMQQVQGAEKEIRSQLGLKETDTAISYGGGYAITLYEAESMERNLKNTVVSSLAGIFLLFFLFFRRIRILLFVALTLILGILWTTVAAAVLFGSLNVMTVTFAAILAGLGVDFGIHISNRFLLERARGLTVHQAIYESITRTGEGIVFGCATTAMAFYALVFAGFKGVSTFGLLVGTGLIICVVTMIFVLPSLLILGTPRAEKSIRQGSVWLFGLPLLGAVLKNKAKVFSVAMIGSWLIFMSVTFARFGFLSFDNRLENMSSTRNPAIETQQRILQEFGNNIEPLLLVAKSSDAQGAMDAIRSTIPLSDALIQENVLVKAENVFKYLPREESYQAFVKKLRMINPERALDGFMKRLARDPLKQEEYRFLQQKRPFLLNALQRKGDDAISDYVIMKEILPEALWNKFFTRDPQSGYYYAANYLYPRKRLVEEKRIVDMKKYFHVDGRRLYFTGVSMLVSRLEFLVRRDFKFITIIISLGMLLVMAMLYRRAWLVAISGFLLLVSITTTIACMQILGIKLNYMNVVAFPLIIGMGIDNSIHMVFCYFEKGQGNMSAMIITTGRAILLTSLTTIVGFGSLVFTRHQGLISLGLVTSIGMAICLLVSLLMFPGMLVMMKVRGYCENTSA